VSPQRRLLVLSSGSIEASVEGRNAWDRVRTIRMDGLFGRVEYLFFPTASDRVERAGEGLTLRDVSGTGGDAPSLPGWIPGRIRRLLGGLGRISRLAREFRPHVAVSADPFLTGAIAWRLSRRLGVPWTVHLVSNYRLSYQVSGMNPMPFLPPPAAFLVERAVLSAADRVVVDRRHYAEYALSRGVPPARVRQVPLYPDPVFYRAPTDPGIWSRLDVPDPEPALYVGRLSPEKYPFDLLRCFEEIHRVFGERHLVIVGGGGGSERPFLERATELGLADRIRVVRGLGRRELASAMGACGVLLATHAGKVLQEAALRGACVVAYDYEWHPEVIEDGRTGRLVPYRDPGAMARAAIELLEDRRRAGKMGEELRTWARNHFRPEEAVRALKTVYQELLEPFGEEGKEGGRS